MFIVPRATVRHNAFYLTTIKGLAMNFVNFKNLSVLLALLVLSFNSNAMITKRYDSNHDCDVYSVLNKVKNAQGDYVLARELRRNEEVHDERNHYGLESKNLSIDFDKRKASFEVITQVSFGFNENLLQNDGAKVSIDSAHPQFNEVINQVNKKLLSFSQICVDREQNLIYLEK